MKHVFMASLKKKTIFFYLIKYKHYKLKTNQE